MTALAMVLDYAGTAPNPARDRIAVRLPRAESEEPAPPDAATVEAVAGLLAVPYMLALVALDVTGCRVGELEAATVGDVDEHRRAWMIRSAVAKTKRPRWAEMPADVFDVLMMRIGPRDDRD